MVTPVGDPPSEAGTTPGSSAGRPGIPLCRDDLDLDSARVLDAFPVRAGIGPSTIATQAGVELDTVIRCLGLLAGCGFIERCDRGWRLTRKAR
jgi:DNA processing protein